MPLDERERSAFHEAGHAVAAVLASRPFKYVSLRELREHVGGDVVLYTEGVVYPHASESARHALLRKGQLDDSEMLIAMSGMIAETIHVGAYDDAAKASGAWDLHNVNVALAVRFGCRPDQVCARPEWKAIESEAVDRCFGALRSNWQAVERVAGALLEHGKLKFETVRSLVLWRELT